MRIKVNKRINTYIGAILLLIISTVISPYLGILFSYLCVLLGIFYDNRFGLYYFVGFCFIQNILMLFLANRFTQSSTTLFFLSKEIMIYGIAVINIIRSHKNKIGKQDAIFLLYTLALIVAFAFSNEGMYSRILSLREMLLPFVCFYFGLVANIKKLDMKRFCRFIVYLGIFLALFGLIERFILGDSFWSSLPISRYQQNKGTVFPLYRGVPLNYYTWDYLQITHRIERRLVSFLVDPLMSAHFMFLSFVLCDFAYEKSTKRSIVKSLLLVACILTLCKGVYLGIVIYCLIRGLRRASFAMVKRIIYIGLIVGVIVIAVGYRLVATYMPTSSILIHMRGLLSVFNNPFGHGLGSAGVVTSRLSTGEAAEIGESFIGVLNYQLGIIGIIVFFAFMLYLFFMLFKNYSRTANELYLSSAILLLSIFIESFFSESAISIIGTGLYFIFTGIAISNARNGYTYHVTTKSPGENRNSAYSFIAERKGTTN